jgi:hypothetical protein
MRFFGHNNKDIVFGKGQLTMASEKYSFVKSLIIRGFGAFALSAGTGLGIIYCSYQNYWSVTIARTQTVDFNILSNILPARISSNLLSKNYLDLQKSLDANYGLFGIIVTDCKTTVAICPNQKIIYASSAKVVSLSNGTQKLIARSKYANSWIEKLDRADRPAQLLAGELYTILQDPPSSQPEWGFDHPRAKQVTTYPQKLDKGKIIGRVYFLRGNPESFISAMKAWFNNLLDNSSSNSVYNAITIASLFTGLLVWSLSEIVYFKSKKAREYRFIAAELTKNLKTTLDERQTAQSQIEQAELEITLLSQALEFATVNLEHTASKSGDLKSEVSEENLIYIGQAEAQISLLNQTLGFLSKIIISAQNKVEASDKKIKELERTYNISLANAVDRELNELIQEEKERNQVISGLKENICFLEVEKDILNDKNTNLNKQLEECVKVAVHFTSIDEALNQAQKDFPILNIRRSVWNHAHCLSKDNADKVYVNLLKLAKIGHLCLYSPDHQLNGVDILTLFRNEEKITCNRESTETMNKYGDERPLLHNSRERMNLHLRIGELRMYFYFDRDTKEVVIGYLGRHLRTVMFPA